MSAQSVQHAFTGLDHLLTGCCGQNEFAAFQINTFPMLEFDNSTLANMTAALDDGCKMLSGASDTARNRKRIGDAIIAAARFGIHNERDL
jgi:hypothetical protein